MMEVENSTPKIDGDRTRAAILKAAQDLFVAHGFAATSMATVARQAGVTKSLIHHHFGSKRELWDAVKVSVMEDYQAQQRQMLTERTPDLSLIEDSMVVYFRFLQRNPHVVRLWNWMVIEGDQECAAMTKDLTQAGVETLRRAQAQGFVRADLEPEFVLAQFFALVRGWFNERAVLQATVLEGASDEVCDERYLRNAVRTFIDGLAPR
jgi:TetR/AcrR family transcriptional regulator